MGNLELESSAAAEVEEMQKTAVFRLKKGKGKKVKKDNSYWFVVVLWIKGRKKLQNQVVLYVTASLLLSMNETENGSKWRYAHTKRKGLLHGRS